MKVTIDNAKSYEWGEGCKAWHLLQSKGLGVIQEKMEPGTSEKEHYHRHTQQYFYMLEGTAEFNLGNKVLFLKKGEGVFVKPGLAHYISNKSTDPIHFLVISEPHSHADRINLEDR